MEPVESDNSAKRRRSHHPGDLDRSSSFQTSPITDDELLGQRKIGKNGSTLQSNKRKGGPSTRHVILGALKAVEEDSLIHTSKRRRNEDFDPSSSSSSRVSPIEGDDKPSRLGARGNRVLHKPPTRNQSSEVGRSKPTSASKRPRVQTKLSPEPEESVWPYVKASSAEDEAYISRLRERAALIRPKKGKKVVKATDEQITSEGLVYLPQSQRIFKGFRFRTYYLVLFMLLAHSLGFYPREETWSFSGPKMNKALSHGAELVTDWQESTHIIVVHNGSDIHLNDLFKHLGVTNFPVSLHRRPIRLLVNSTRMKQYW